MGTSMVLSLVLGAALSLLGGLVLGWHLKSRLRRTEIDRARDEAHEIIKQTRREAETQKRQALLQAREEWLQHKARLEQELRGKAREGQQQQRALEEREAGLRDRDQRLRGRERDLETREEALQRMQTETGRERDRVRRLGDELNEQLGKIAGLTGEDARQMLLHNIRQEVRFEAARMIREAREEAQEKAEVEAGKIVS
ncbi:MAG TPA: Rnase Y domain-containing protein, partial [Candidatus Polarisedimenticolia bacterium]|nr:Rnase Y domain-containing protein [Candidatus Polarisedimenticolia bacterium]